MKTTKKTRNYCTTGEKLPRGSFGRGRSFVKYCARHLLDVRNYKLRQKTTKKLAGPHRKTHITYILRDKAHATYRRMAS